MTPNPTGTCLNCGAPLPHGHAFYCGRECHQAYRRANHVTQKAGAHEHHYTDGVCVRCVNEMRRKENARNKKYITSGGTVPQASIAGRR